MIKLIIVAVMAFADAAAELPCEDRAELSWELAEAAGERSDAAWEDTLALCEEP